MISTKTQFGLDIISISKSISRHIQKIYSLQTRTFYSNEGSDLTKTAIEGNASARGKGAGSS